MPARSEKSRARRARPSAAHPQPTRTAGPFQRIYRAVRAIPPGRVATYGQVARRAGLSNGARTVGWALRALSEEAVTTVPWHRVLGAGGRVSLPESSGAGLQRARLRAEGVRFRGGRVNLERYGI